VYCDIQIIPAVMEYLPKQSILALRQVTKESKAAIEKVLGTHYASPRQGALKFQHDETFYRFHKLMDEINEKYDFTKESVEEFLTCLRTGREAVVDGNAPEVADAVDGQNEVSNGEEEEQDSEDGSEQDSDEGREQDSEEVHEIEEELEIEVLTVEEDEPDLAQAEEVINAQLDEETEEVVHVIVAELIGDELVARSPNNPFPTRHITIPLVTYEDLDVNLMKMLAMYGHNVWHLTIGPSDNDNQVTDVDLALRNLVWILGRTPNLKILDFIPKRWRDCWVKLLKWENPNLISFPSLNQLVSLSLGVTLPSMLPPFYLELIKAYGTQLTSLDHHHHSFSRSVIEYLPKLTRFALYCDNASELRSVGQVGWQLERLFVVGNFKRQAHEMFEVLGLFGRSLVELDLNDDMFYGYTKLENPSNWVVKPMSKLKILRVSFGSD